MPELPEVETIARGLQRLTGRRVTGVFLARRDILHGHVHLVDAVSGERPYAPARRRRRQQPDAALALPCMKGRRMVEVRRIGKYLRFHFDAAIDLFVHLGMTGRLVLMPRSTPLEPHTHARFTFAGTREELRFCDPRRFGGLWIVEQRKDVSPGMLSSATRDGARSIWVGRRLPPAGFDPLEAPASQWRALMQRRRQIKALLLDQRWIGGIGNIYCDESLFRAGVHPRTPACDLDDRRVQRLRRAVRQVLSEAITAGGSSISDYRDADNRSGWFQVRHRVYDRAGEPCRRCGGRIERLVVAGRGTFICPACQAAPAGNGTRTRI